MARADTNTLLSLDRFSTIMGISPVRFNGAAAITIPGSNVKLFDIDHDVNNTWPQFSYQTNDQISREELAQEISRAESDIAAYIGYFPGPRWHSQEMHRYPQYHRREFYGIGRDMRGQYKAVQTRWGKFIQGGRRAVSVIEAGAAVVYSDEDGDGWEETATITITGVTVSDICELKFYFIDENGAQTWEIRPPRTKTLVSGTLTATFFTWQLIDPDLWNAFPTTANTGGGVGIDISTPPTNVESTIDVYREFTDFSLPSALFFWEDLPIGQTLTISTGGACSSCDNTGCSACVLCTQNACLHFRDVNEGFAVPVPATFDVDSDQWNQNAFAIGRDPDNVKFWYYAGNLSENFLRDTNCEPLSYFFEDMIAKLAVARLDRPFPANNNVTAWVRDLRRDRTLTPAEGISFAVSPEVLSPVSNPFGTRGGEINAYQQLKGFVMDKVAESAVIA